MQNHGNMQRLYIHPLPLRIWHWINAGGIVLMILTGLQMRYVGLIDVAPFRTAVIVHNWVGFALIANFFVWLVFYLSSDRVKIYHAELNPRKHFLGSFRQIYYYGFGIFEDDPNPHRLTVYRKFNPLQSMFYQIVMMLCLPIQFYTGIMLWYATRFRGQVDFFGGLRVIDTAHVLIFIFLVFFVIIHIYLATLGHTRMEHIKGMLTGYEEVEVVPTAPEPKPASSSNARPT